MVVVAVSFSRSSFLSPSSFVFFSFVLSLHSSWQQSVAKALHLPSRKLRSQDVLYAVRVKEHYIFARVIIGTTHIHLQCCYAAEPACCCSKKRDTRAHIHRWRPIHLDLPCKCNARKRKRRMVRALSIIAIQTTRLHSEGYTC